ncbi:mucin-12 isoform X3 [Folsomia candida]|uniref:mucin-12 isoform X3 n=1 Tax=Folsomia candida TaxID=158441 RepID=UPI001604CA34|nr:mucin-12 isoform X3 [Folsomia candida]
MTVSYTGDVANGSSFGCFWKILGRWRGSVYKLIWRELIAYLFLYFTINAMYRLGMTEDQRRIFERVKVYCSKQIESIPMSFVLGFYVTLIVKRWWDQYWILPMPDSLALYISASIHGQDERGRLLRRTIMRYAMMAYIICLQRISFRVKKRFPSLEHLVDAGLMTDNEKKIFDLMDNKTKVLKFWMPVVWASNLINRARAEGRIHSDQMVQTIVTELSDFRRKLGRVMVYDTVSVPLVYTQVVTLAVYTYFLAALIGRQWVNPPNPTLIYPGYELDLYFPIFLSLQFIFYIGWLKVAETLINPFGEDDDDFELNWLIDRHIKVSYMVVDEMHEEHPELLKDQYWEQVVPEDLPYNIASEHFRRHEPQGSTASLKVKASESVYADLTSVKRHSAIPDEVYADYYTLQESVTDSPLPDSRKNWIQRQWSRVGSLRSTSSSSSRNRQHSHGHGPLPTTVLPNSGHRPSLYERILSRRSSKDHRNSSRYLPNRLNTLSIAKEGNYTLMANPNSRPRVPTPDVTKENQVNFHQSHAPPMEKMPNRALYSNDSSVMTQTVTNPGYGSPSNRRTVTTTTTLPQNGTLSVQPQIPPPVPSSPRIAHMKYVTSSVPPPLPPSTPSISSPLTIPTPISQREMLPPPYDANLDESPSSSPINGGTMLSPIAENDGSPYSTSSTTRSCRSSNYPTTTSIFGLGRKPSPPPLDELPPIPQPTIPRKTRRLGSSRRVIGGEEFPLDTKDLLTPSSVIDELESVLKETIFDGRVNNGFVPDLIEEGNAKEEDDDDEDELDSSRNYMTIAEVNESKAELEKKLQQSQLSNRDPGGGEGGVGDGPGSDIPPSLPLPRCPTFPGAAISNTNNIQSSSYHAASSSDPTSSDKPTTSSLGGKGGKIPTKSASSAALVPLHDAEVDDGYDEKGSYNDEEEFSSSTVVDIEVASPSHSLDDNSFSPNNSNSHDNNANISTNNNNTISHNTKQKRSNNSSNSSSSRSTSKSGSGSSSPDLLSSGSGATGTPKYRKKSASSSSSSQNDPTNSSPKGTNSPVPQNEMTISSHSPKRKRKGRKKGGTEEQDVVAPVLEPAQPQPPPVLSKDCEVFV